MKKLFMAGILGAILVFGANLVFSKNQSGQNVQNYVLSLPKQPLSQQEIRDLMHMREEEKLARDVYLTLYQKWGFRIFNNISQSETWHMQMVKFLIDKYGLNDPVKNDQVGVFTSSQMAKLYKELVKRGLSNKIEALKVGALIEDLDIYDLDEAIKKSDNTDINFVYSRLRTGSTNHMRAFIGWLTTYGVTYKPQYISQEEFNIIIQQKRGGKRW
ncbi:MAG: DUF2202 domain-containing protein [Desulfonauticus sp.]|nr:DUF2202 domain-containing protein [Desulfonauticus sp.]